MNLNYIQISSRSCQWASTSGIQIIYGQYSGNGGKRCSDKSAAKLIRSSAYIGVNHSPILIKIINTSNSGSKTRGAAAPRTRITCAYFLVPEEPSLKLSRLAKLQRTNSSPNSNCRRSKSAIFISRNINSNINSLLRLRVGTHYIYIYIDIYLSDERYIPEVEMKTI